MLNEIPKEQIKGYECKHVSYVRAKDGSDDDLLVIKEQVHLKDGTVIPNIRFIENFERDFWVTKPGFRTNTDKTEWEFENRLQKYSCTQANLPKAVARALGNPAFKGSMRMLSRSPYLYGADISTPVLAKRKYMDKYPDCISLNRVSVLDIETDVVNGTDEPISVSLTFKDRAILTVTEAFIGGISDVIEKTYKKFEEHLGSYAKARNIKLEVVICKNSALAIKEVMDRAHKWMPDFIAIWNINYDLPKMLKALDKHGYDPDEVFSHPTLPDRYKTSRYIEGASNKLTASGKYMSLHHADRWHTMECPASFYFIDAMCVYKRVRIAKGNESSYALDAVLNKHLKLGKLNFKEADGYTGLEWHQFMQKNYKIEYLVYNLFDCIGVELLDEKTKDLSSTISVLCEHSEYSRFPSQPRRTCDDLHFFVQKHGRVIATTSDMMEDELDQHIVSMKEWISCAL